MTSLFDNSLQDLDAGETVEETTEQAVIEDPEESTDETEELNEEEGESSEDESEDESEEESEKSEDDVFVVDGEEFTGEQLRNAKEARELEKGFKAEFTKKTTALAEERKALEVKAQSLDELARELEVLVKEDDDIDWKELEEDNPHEHIRLKRLSDKRKEALKSVKSNLKPVDKKPSPDELAAEMNVLIDLNPNWAKKDESGNITELTDDYKKDMKELSSHALELGFTAEELSSFTRAPMIKALLNSLKSKQTNGKIEIAKKRIKPKVVKPSVKKPKVESSSIFNKSLL